MNMSKSKPTQTADIDGADRRWKDLYRVGFISSLALPAALVFAVLAFFIWPYTPGSTDVANILTVLHNDRIAGLMSLDLSVVILLPLLLMQLLAVYTALKNVSELYALLALILGITGVVLWLAARPLIEMAYLSDQYVAATTASARSSYLAAGEAVHAVFNGTNWLLSQFLINLSYITSCVLMLRSTVFSKATAYTGLGLALFGCAFWLPVIGPLLSLLSTIAGVIWYILMARDFFRLGRQLDRVESSVIATGEFA
jgi:hypothetical protein